MTSTHKVPKKITAFLALIFLAPALYIFIVWLNAFNQDISQTQKISLFTSHFVILNDYRSLLYVTVACSIVAMIFAAKSFKQPIIGLRIAMFVTVIVAALIFFLIVFQLL